MPSRSPKESMEAYSIIQPGQVLDHSVGPPKPSLPRCPTNQLPLKDMLQPRPNTMMKASIGN